VRTIEVDESDLAKIFDVLVLNEVFHTNRDQMNAATHRAPQVRFSPITTETIAARERLDLILSTA